MPLLVLVHDTNMVDALMPPCKRGARKIIVPSSGLPGFCLSFFCFVLLLLLAFVLFLMI